MVSKDKTTITFHSGILTIGGTVIEVAYKDSHIFFDFGTEFLPKLELTDESVQTLVSLTNTKGMKIKTMPIRRSLSHMRI